MKRFGLTVFGMLVAVAIGAYFFRRVTEEEEEIPMGIFDRVGDFLVRLTTSEESRLSQLETETQEQARALVQRLHDEGIEVSVGQTFRTPAQEKLLIAAGKTSVNLIHSWHELGRALDIYPTTSAGLPDYNPTEEGLNVYRRMHAAAEDMGFRSIAFNADGSKRLITNAKGKKIWDGGHIEWRHPYDTIAQAIAAEGEDIG